MPLSVEPVGPPCGHAYGYRRKQGPSRDWKKIAFWDGAIVDLVNVRFASELYRMSPEAVTAMRAREGKKK